MKTLNRSIVLFSAAAAALVSSATFAQDAAGAGYAVQKTLPIGGPGRWDYAYFDAASQHIFLTRSTHTQAIDLNGKVLMDIQGQKRSHGTAIATSAGRGFITDGGDGTVVIFDLKTGNVLGKAAAADDADGIIYDTGTNKVLAGCGDAGQLAVLSPDVDPKAGKADLIDLGGKPEFVAADGTGKAFVNLEDKNQVAVVDLKSMKTTAHWPIGTGEEPAGLAIDPVHHELFVGCHNEKMIILSTDDGRVLAEVHIGKGNDACAFDAGTGEAFASCGDGTLTVVKESAPGKFTTSSVKTMQGARTMTIDPGTHIIYLPTADYDPVKKQGKWPAMVPNTFKLVVVAPMAGK